MIELVYCTGWKPLTPITQMESRRGSVEFFGSSGGNRYCRNHSKPAQWACDTHWFSARPTRQSYVFRTVFNPGQAGISSAPFLRWSSAAPAVPDPVVRCQTIQERGRSVVRAGAQTSA